MKHNLFFCRAWLVVFMLKSGQLFAEMPPAPTVSVAHVEASTITEWLEFTGRLSSVDSVDLRPRVSGQVSKVHFQEGGEVRTGDVLFELDQRPFTAALNQAKAELEQAETLKKQAERESKRGKELLSRRVISKEDNEARIAAAARARSAVAAATAALSLAQLNLEFSQIVAPIPGRVSLANTTAGNWVQAGETLLTRIVATDRLYIDLSIDEGTFLAHAQDWKVGHTKIRFVVGGEANHSQEAVLSFIDNQVNPRTGTIQLRALLNEPKALLRPGLFAKTSVPGKGPYKGVLINDRAIATDQGSRYVLVLGENNIATYRPVTLGPMVDGLRVIRSGINPGETIIVKGLMKAQPGAPVNPIHVSMKELN